MFIEFIVSPLPFFQSCFFFEMPIQWLLGISVLHVT